MFIPETNRDKHQSKYYNTKNGTFSLTKLSEMETFSEAKYFNSDTETISVQLLIVDNNV